MKLITLLLFSLFISINCFAQIPTLPDSTSAPGQMIHRLSKTGITSRSVKDTIANVNLPVYRFCDRNVATLDSLSKILTDQQLTALFNSSNGVLKISGFILIIRKDNEKTVAMNKLNELLAQNINLLTESCTDALSSVSLGRFAYNLFIRENKFYDPHFILTNGEKKGLDAKLTAYESKAGVKY